MAHEAEQADVEARVEVDEGDRIVGWDRGAERLTGIRAATARGRRLAELLEVRDPWGNRACFCGIHETLRRGEPLRPFLAYARTATGDAIRLVIGPAAARPGGRGGAVLVLHLRRDLRRVRDRRRAVPLATREPRPEALARSPLTQREQEVLRLLANGAGTQAMAARLGISVVTVRNHVQRVLDRLGAHSRLAAVATARERGWLD